MWKTDGLNIAMAEGDYGIELPIVVNGTTIASTETILLTVKREPNGAAVLTKEITGIQNNRITVSL